jgi:hypothetical protein
MYATTKNSSIIIHVTLEIAALTKDSRFDCTAFVCPESTSPWIIFQIASFNHWGSSQAGIYPRPRVP